MGVVCVRVRVNTAQFNEFDKNSSFSVILMIRYYFYSSAPSAFLFRSTCYLFVLVYLFASFKAFYEH